MLKRKSLSLSNIYEVVIIGSGPAGLCAVIYATRAKLKAIVVEKEYMGTGMIGESERVDNYPGLFGESGYDLGEKFRSHAKALGAEFCEGEAVRINERGGIYEILLDDGRKLETVTIIYAAGTTHRRLGIRGEKEFYGRGVSQCAVCDGAFYKDKEVAVVGGGDAALGDALFLSRIAKKVYLIHRRQELRANKTLQEQVRKRDNIELVLSTVPKEIIGEKKVSGIIVECAGVQRTIKTDGVFTAIGSIPNTSMLEGIANLDGNGYVIAGEDGITSAKGIFAAGDVRTKKLRQVVTATCDGANCVYSAEEYIQKL